MKLTRFFLLVTALICTNLANAGAIGDFLKKELGKEAKDFNFVDGNISFHTGAIGSVYNITALNPQNVLMENFELYNVPPYRAEALSDKQLKDLENGFGQDYLTVVPPIWENIAFSDAELNRFALKIVVPKIAGMIDVSGGLDVSKWDTQMITIKKIVRRKLYKNGGAYFKYIKGLDPEDEVRRRYLNNKRFAFVSEDILVTGFNATICHGADVDVELKAELGGLQIASQAFDRVMAVLGNKPETETLPSGEGNTGNANSNSAPISPDACLELFNKEIAGVEAGANGSDISTVVNARTINCARRMGPAYCKKYNESGLAGPGLGVRFGHFGERCLSATANAPFVVARKITVQRARPEIDRRKEICTEGLFIIDESEKVSSHSYVLRSQYNINFVLNDLRPKVGDSINLCRGESGGDAVGIFEELSTDHVKIKLIKGDDPFTSGPEIDWSVQPGKFENWGWESNPNFDWVLGSGSIVNPPEVPSEGNYSDI